MMAAQETLDYLRKLRRTNPRVVPMFRELCEETLVTVRTIQGRTAVTIHASGCVREFTRNEVTILMTLREAILTGQLQHARPFSFADWPSEAATAAARYVRTTRKPVRLRSEDADARVGRGVRRELSEDKRWELANNR